MSAMQFLVNTLFELYLMVVLLRFWLQLARADFYNPFSQFVVKATHPIVGPLRRVLPSIGRIDTATLVLALLVAGLKIVALNLIIGNTNINPLGLVIGSFYLVVKEALSLMMWVLIIRAIMSWVSQGYNPMDMVLGQLTEPLLAPIRRRLPSLGGLDLSVMVVILVIIFLQKLLGDVFGYF
ncbi:MAG: YggT family protein [Alteromonadaceae bacterium]|jgi:YggT family protein|uniref:YggT family protein n=2 Tax=Paraglaciecola mesophila TaxID=197222 RepID=K6XQF6_9ALTE|nr:YggT family protein [Paraglaciecola mesophila]MAD17039.1 YggT family protein [Alteromonadaceae bacterium]GAC22844.1 YggT family protein [Paraglaciecola mesophila KMM 241]|tara:strand:- start:5026 stop:5568 length:543 start_codon:yes stop_codon:yes gene_type:complete